jgi:hypothetical protein
MTLLTDAEIMKLVTQTAIDVAKLHGLVPWRPDITNNGLTTSFPIIVTGRVVKVTLEMVKE